MPRQPDGLSVLGYEALVGQSSSPGHAGRRAATIPSLLRTSGAGAPLRSGILIVIGAQGTPASRPLTGNPNPARSRRPRRRRLLGRPRLSDLLPQPGLRLAPAPPPAGRLARRDKSVSVAGAPLFGHADDHVLVWPPRPAASAAPTTSRVEPSMAPPRVGVHHLPAAKGAVGRADHKVVALDQWKRYPRAAICTHPSEPASSCSASSSRVPGRVTRW